MVTYASVAETVKGGTRAYDSSRRREAAAARRAAILAAAHDLFVEQGYAATTMQAVAERAGVALDTVYASVGTKPALLAALNLQAVTGRDDTPDVEEWDFVRRIRSEPDAARKLELYARSVAAIRPATGAAPPRGQGGSDLQPGDRPPLEADHPPAGAEPEALRRGAGRHRPSPARTHARRGPRHPLGHKRPRVVGAPGPRTRVVGGPLRPVAHRHLDSDAAGSAG